MTNPLPIIIIGTGLAGVSVAKEFRKLDTTTPLILITQDDGHFYSKPLLSTAYHQGKSPGDLVITDVALLQNQLNATIMTFSNVTLMDSTMQIITVQTPDDIISIHYQKCVFANGAKPRPLPLIDSLSSHYRINSLMDYALFKRATDAWQRLTIIGSGLVGCEFAHDFTKSHLSLQVVTPDPYPLYGLVPDLIGHALKEALADKGVSFNTQAQVTHALQLENTCHLTLSNENTLQSDAVLIAIGLKPNVAIALDAGFAVNQGIVVNDNLECSIAHHYALGDCAEIAGVCRQYVAPILSSARALAQTLFGKPTKAILPNLPISLKVDCYPIIVSPPKPGCEGNWQFENQDNHYQGLFYDKQGVLQGFALSGSFLAKRQEYQAALIANVSQN
jgi:rubredoxin-NAD+ reductase